MLPKRPRTNSAKRFLKQVIDDEQRFMAEEGLSPRGEGSPRGVGFFSIGASATDSEQRLKTNSSPASLERVSHP